MGSGPRAANFAEKLNSGDCPHYELVGYVDEEWDGQEQLRKVGKPLLGSLDEIDRVLGSEVVDEVIIALPVKSFYEKIESVVKSCEEQGITVRFLNDLFSLQTAKMRSQSIYDHPVLTIHSVPIHRYYMVIKRALDMSASISLLLVLLPFFLVAGILIKLDSRGPVFFIQERMGYNKRMFPFLKFRTMVADAEERMEDVASLNMETGPAFKIRNDPRITNFGKFLRKTSLDELPQLINILRGEMSLVGPRPLFRWEVERISESWIKTALQHETGPDRALAGKRQKQSGF